MFVYICTLPTNIYMSSELIIYNVVKLEILVLVFRTQNHNRSTNFSIETI
jgi:hypothetical protein